jgi:hypothetical protein
MTGNSQDRLALARERSGRAKPERMEIVRLEYAPAPRDLSREAAPLVYLIAPALRFHPTTDVLHRYLSRDMEIICVGLAKSWRSGLRVMFRQ